MTTTLNFATALGYQVLIEKNPDSVAKARENIKAAGLSNIVTIIEGDIFQLVDILPPA